MSFKKRQNRTHIFIASPPPAAASRGWSHQLHQVERRGEERRGDDGNAGDGSGPSWRQTAIALHPAKREYDPPATLQSMFSICYSRGGGYMWMYLEHRQRTNRTKGSCLNFQLVAQFFCVSGLKRNVIISQQGV